MATKTFNVLLFCEKTTLTSISLRGLLENCAEGFTLQFSLDGEVFFDIKVEETVKDALRLLKEVDIHLIVIDLAPFRWPLVEDLLASLDAKKLEKVVGFGDPCRPDIKDGWRWPLLFGQYLGEMNDILGAILLAGGK